MSAKPALETTKPRREWLASLTAEERYQAACMTGDLMASREIRGELVMMALAVCALMADAFAIAWIAS